LLGVWHGGAVGLVLERVCRPEPWQPMRCQARSGLIVGGVAVGARSFVADAAELRGADIGLSG